MGIITAITDTDLYTFTVCFLYLQKFPRSIVTYKFNDRNNTIYPKGFDKLVMAEVEAMSNITFTNEEEDFMTNKCYYLPKWFYSFLHGYKFDPNEVKVIQDEIGHLDVEISGYAWRTVFWEVPLLAIISELYHKEVGDDKFVEDVQVIENAKIKAYKMLINGLTFSEFGTRRRYSKKVQEQVLVSISNTYETLNKTTPKLGKFAGTSNVYLAMKYDLTPIGTMSHQVISLCGALFGYQEANFMAMKYWQEVFNSDLGIFLYDTYGWDTFEKNFSKMFAMLFHGLRVDSGDNLQAVDKIIKKYESLNIVPSTKQVTFSNGLNVLDAIEIHKYVGSKILDNYGIGTFLTCDIPQVKPLSIVIKLNEARMTENTEKRKCIKLSDDIGKYSGDFEEITLCKKTLKILN